MSKSTHEWYVAEWAIRMLRRFAKDAKPWLLETHFVEPHDPYFPLKKYLRSLRSEVDSRSEELPRHLRRQAGDAPPRIGYLG